ncbi:MAG: shikimate kinase [Tannerellaceae bacterium]|jgi:shikimate kinase|nr:shikimate kinase [Tannerellaceae bacterium]
MKRIYLIGYMGAGKTTVGKKLARQMNLSFIDLDHYIEARYHKMVRQLFEEKGEAVFRDIECKMLHETGMIENVVISTGGGTPCFFDNMSFMNQTGTTVYLKTSSGELTKRLELVKHTRPVLKGLSGEKLKQFITDNLEKRDPWYKQASVIFDAEKMLTENDVNEITCELKKLLQ